MNKFALSLFVVAASAAYVWTQDGPPPADDLLGGTAPMTDAAPAAASASLPTPPVRSSARPASLPGPFRPPVRRIATEAVYVVPQADSVVARPRVTLAAGAVAYADGTYDGPAVDAYYGIIQIQAIVQGGRLSGIKVLQYPSDRRTSIAINRQALPMLRDEVVAAQSANVDIVSGATLTSEAFIRSIGGALAQARP
jgi:uncharacterized protein with FMN-binding domain